MVAIVNIDDNTFSINGIKYKKIFVAVPAGSDSIRIVSAYDGRFEVLPVTKVSEVTVDGVAAATQAELISSVIDIILNRISPSDVTGKLDKDGYTGTAKDLDQKIDSTASGIKGTLFIAGLPDGAGGFEAPSEDGNYNAGEAGTYTGLLDNTGAAIVVSSGDITNSQTILNKKGDVWTKTVIEYGFSASPAAVLPDENATEDEPAKAIETYKLNETQTPFRELSEINSMPFIETAASAGLGITEEQIDEGVPVKYVDFPLSVANTGMYILFVNAETANFTTRTFDIVAVYPFNGIVGNNRIQINRAFPVDTLFGVASSTAQFQTYQTDNTAKQKLYRNPGATAQPAVGASITASATVTTFGFPYRIVTYTKADALAFQKQITENQNAIAPKWIPAKSVKDFSAGGFTQSGFTLGTSATSSTANAQFINDTQYISDRRLTRFKAVMAAGSIVYVAARRTYSPTGNLSTYARVNLTDNKLQIYQNGTSTTLIKEVALNQTHVPADEYLIELERINTKTVFRLINYRTGETDELIYNENVANAFGAGNHRAFYSFGLVSGTVEVKSFQVFVAEAKTAVVGDSNTEENGRSDVARIALPNWTTLLKVDLGQDLIVVAHSGMTITDAQTAITNELAFIKPKYAIFQIGTNGGATTAQFQALIDACEALEIIPIINHVPMSDRPPGDSNSAITINNNIDALVNAENYIGALMDVATALNNNPADGYDPSIYDTAGIHPTYFGAIKMYERALIDIILLRRIK